MTPPSSQPGSLLSRGVDLTLQVLGLAVQLVVSLTETWPTIRTLADRSLDTHPGLVLVVLSQTGSLPALL